MHREKNNRSKNKVVKVTLKNSSTSAKAGQRWPLASQLSEVLVQRAEPSSGKALWCEKQKLSADQKAGRRAAQAARLEA